MTTVFGSSRAGLFCAKCGEEFPTMQYEKESDPFGTGDSPTDYEPKGTACCHADLEDDDGNLVEPSEIEIDLH